jgi:hypothetical protein
MAARTDLGFTRGGVDRAAHAALLGHAALGETEAVIPTPFGQKYLIRGTIEGPNRTNASVVAVWILAEPAEGPRFVTAYPEEKS